MRIQRLTLVLPFLLLAGCNAGTTKNNASADGVALDSDESAASGAIAASDAAIGPMFGAAPGAGPGGHPGCTPDVTVLATTAVCGHDVPSSVQIDWNCAGPEGQTLTGTDLVATTVVPDACPATSLSIDQSITLNETRTHDAHSQNVSGSSTASWTQVPPPSPSGTPAPGSMPPPPPPASRSITFDVHVVATDTDSNQTVHDAQVTGSRTVDFDDAGTAGDHTDDRLIENGAISLEDVVVAKKFARTDNDVALARSCCYPVGGSSTLVITDLADATAPDVTRTISFGPSCGQATREDGTAVTFPACSVPPPPAP